MSGSSRAGKALNRCRVVIDSGMRIEWAPNPDGSYPGTECHRREEAGFIEAIDAHASELEAIIDQFATGGREFLSAGDPYFSTQRQTGVHYGRWHVFVDVAAVPELDEEELKALAEQFAEERDANARDKATPPWGSEDDPFSF